MNPKRNNAVAGAIGLRPTLTVLACVMATACGGGGGGSSSGGSSVTLSGVVATGAAVTNASVSYRCASGSGTITANATTGAYNSGAINVTLPCVLEATGTAGSASVTLHSVAAGSGTSVTANITPLTELLVAQLTGQNPATYFGSPTNLGTTVTDGNINSAQSAVVATLNAAGINTGSISNIVSGSLTAGSGTGYDAVLDTLGTTLASAGSTLGDLTTTVANTSAGGSASSTTGNEATSSMLPADLILKPKASTCGALRSGNYQGMVIKPSATPSATGTITTLGTATIDATNAAGPFVTYNDGHTETWTVMPGDSCLYTVTEGIYDGSFAVAPSGIITGRRSGTWTDGETTYDPNYRLLLIIPTQTIPIADLAGTWNYIGWGPNGGSFMNPGILTLAANGTGTVKCATESPATPESACIVEPSVTTFTVNPAGGYDVVDTIGSTVQTTNRAFAYRAGNGQTIMAILRADGRFYMASKYRALTLPTVGDDSRAITAQMDTTFAAGDALGYARRVVTAVNTGANTYTRTLTNLLNGVSHEQTLAINNARNGWLYRAAGTTTASDGSTVTIREMYALNLGVGINPNYYPATGRFGITTIHP